MLRYVMEAGKAASETELAAHIELEEQESSDRTIESIQSRHRAHSWAVPGVERIHLWLECDASSGTGESEASPWDDSITPVSCSINELATPKIAPYPTTTKRMTRPRSNAISFVKSAETSTMTTNAFQPPAKPESSAHRDAPNEKVYGGSTTKRHRRPSKKKSKATAKATQPKSDEGDTASSSKFPPHETKRGNKDASTAINTSKRSSKVKVRPNKCLPLHNMPSDAGPGHSSNDTTTDAPGQEQRPASGKKRRTGRAARTKARNSKVTRIEKAIHVDESGTDGVAKA
ncbi:hypothetical protein BX600DRAFT_434619 [Xylariales sp. PMI_506]|nr:hypothetical protein BX600DRAFT_434619 [Xylariales sp. PMI_506]